ncbi:juvenile hormone epoxide hydrolase 1-like [Sitophilus oryzae]|uniref:Epoxide hydrolase n=1 Tax=Sitophilus oryzae TaxID=7048 RepID=A0A6J2Y3M5_SITOR|nr:juvenile hormone epoxide hydrolase 1-like [Sitophilus oryzae]
MAVCSLCLIVFSAIVGLIGLVIYKLFSKKPIPQLDSTQYWGPGEQPKEIDTSIRSFKIEVSDEEIADLKWRLDHLRPLQPPLEGIAQEYGINSNLVKEIVEFWRTKYNWKEREEVFNQYPQFKTNIQGLDIHYLHVKPANPGQKKVVPLLLVHGWPGSIREFYYVIPTFTKVSEERGFVFEVIAPSIPGYGFSQAASKPGLGAAQIAVVMNNLMQRIGHKKFYCQGGDFGAIILQQLCVLYPENVLGYHTNMAYVATPWSYIKYALGTFNKSWVVKPEHTNRVYPLWQKFEHRILETGYLHLQATKPDTLGVGLTDSPAGLAAYILEKFTTGTNITWQKRVDGGLLEKYTYIELLDNVMIYWWTRTATTSVRLYAESFSKKQRAMKLLMYPLRVPTAIARYKYDFYFADGILDEVFPNRLQVSDLDGGHFAAFEIPDLFAADVISAVEKFEKYNSIKEKTE